VCDACREIAEGRDVDVLEIDGATYTGVDAVREVIVEPLAIAPMRDRSKIFIIDEVHRLSKHAFDALLKSIEEPPPYVRFMMATTDLHAVPATIQSRSQVFELRTLPFASIRAQLTRVAEGEGVRIDEAALSLVARSAEGSMRDALSALDQVLAFTPDAVTAADVSTVLGVIGRDRQFEIVETVAAEDLAGAFAQAAAVVEAGYDLRVVCRELARLVRDLLVVTIDPTRLADPEIAAEGERDRLKALAARYSREDFMRAFDLLSRAELDIRASSQPRHQFEMALVKWIHLRKLTPLSDLLTPQALSPKPQALSPPDPPASELSRGDVKPALLSSIREQNKTFYGMVVAQAQKIDVQGDAIVFTFAPVHKTLKAQLEAKKSWVEQVAQTVSGRRMTVRVVEGAPAPAPDAAADDATARRADLRARAKAEPAVQAVLDVFGGEIEDVEEI
jgi:DNA polymerase-3 subunit gamma/tau